MHNLFDLMLFNDIKDIVNISLSPLEKIVATSLPYIQESKLTREQKILIYKDRKLSAIKELEKNDDK